MQCLNALKHVVLYVIVIIEMATAGGGNNCSDYILKRNLSCPCPETWSSLVSPNVYRRMDYNFDDNPNLAIDDAATIVFENIKILGVDEKKKEVTLELLVYMIWKDTRIKVLDTNNDYAIGLPPITKKTKKPVVWTPHKKFSFVHLRSSRNIQSPIIMSIALLGRDTANKLFVADNFLGNTSTVFVGGQMELGITVWCHFTFNDFPFDHNFCPIKLRFEGMHVKFAEQEFLYFNDYVHKVVDGFLIKIRNLTPTVQKHPKLDIYWTDIGFKVSMKRQVGKYIYQYYLPCFAIVITSSFSFIIPLSAVPGRVSLIVTLFLTLTNIFIVQMVRNIVYFS